MENELGLSEQGLADLRHLIKTRPDALWRALTPEQALALRKAAPAIAERTGSHRWMIYGAGPSAELWGGPPNAAYWLLVDNAGAGT